VAQVAQVTQVAQVAQTFPRFYPGSCHVVIRRLDLVVLGGNWHGKSGTRLDAAGMLDGQRLQGESRESESHATCGDALTRCEDV